MARPKVRKATVRILRSFGHVHAGDQLELEISPVVQGWITVGLAKVVDDGPGQAGPSEPEPDAHERVPDGAEGGGPSSREPGPGFGGGAFGAAPGFDQG